MHTHTHTPATAKQQQNQLKGNRNTKPHKVGEGGELRGRGRHRLTQSREEQETGDIEGKGMVEKREGGGERTKEEGETEQGEARGRRH